jgi:hypothetical protein
MTRKYTPKFKRTPTKSEVKPTKRDIEIIFNIFKHRFLNSNQIIKLLNPKNKLPIQNRLNRLYHHGYLNRISEQDNLFKGSKPLIYAVDNKGANFIIQKGRIPKTNKKIDWSDKNRRIKSQIFLKHTLLIADIMIAFETACKRYPNVKLIEQNEIISNAPSHTRAKDKPYRWNVEYDFENEREATILKLAVEPDKIFGLRFTDKPENQSKVFFFLEADRGIMPIKRKSLKHQTSFYKKMIAYFETHKEKVYKNLFNINNFRVLTITTSQKRIDEMIKQNKNITNNTRLGIFLFADTKALKSADDILKLQWQNGRNEFLSLF